MIGIVAEGDRRRLFLSPSTEDTDVARRSGAKWRPELRIPTNAQKVSARSYGVSHWHQLFTERQLCVLTTFTDLLKEAHALMTERGDSAEYASVVSTYLALAIGRSAHSGSSYARWQNTGDKVAGVFARQAIPMMWDFAEANPFCAATQNWTAQTEWIAKAVDSLPLHVNAGETHQVDAATSNYLNIGPVVVTDPPYYDNISLC